MSDSEQVVGDRLLTIPNVLSLLRLVLVPVFAVLIVTEHDWLALVVLMVSGWTDYFDGWLARRWGQITRFGALLDPLADRLYIFVTLLGLAYREIVPWWLVGLLVLRDAVLTGSLLVLRRAGHEPLPVNLIGKAATFNLLYAFPLLLLGHVDGLVGDVSKPIGWAFAWWGAGLYVWSAVIYLRQSAAVLHRARRQVATS
ncbi:CDP-alcohol phosphatidyltransferase family protein [Spongisporangium articulatum]|uniref:CDP-alcohol phosphatidyltransferase family protein n=1 Tax=Spongisporangium articulatum TaxID=3362603 RepID=A0ABW8ATG1_9ACTN